MKKKALLLTAPLAMIGYASAALPPEVQSTMDSVKDDIQTVGAALIVLAVVVMGFKWLKAQFF